MTTELLTLERWAFGWLELDQQLYMKKHNPVTRNLTSTLDARAHQAKQNKGPGGNVSTSTTSLSLS